MINILIAGKSKKLQNVEAVTRKLTIVYLRQESGLTSELLLECLRHNGLLLDAAVVFDGQDHGKPADERAIQTQKNSDQPWDVWWGHNAQDYDCGKLVFVRYERLTSSENMI